MRRTAAETTAGRDQMLSRRQLLLALAALLGACDRDAPLGSATTATQSVVGTAAPPSTLGTAGARGTPSSPLATPSRGGPSSVATPQGASEVPWDPRRAPLSAQQWDDPASYPLGTPNPGEFWVPDAPEARPPLAFGVIPPESLPRQPSIREYRLATSLPMVGPTLPVYLGGRYHERHRAIFDRVVRRDEPRWVFTPRYSSIWYPEGPPIGERRAIVDAAAARQHASELLAGRGLLPPETLVAAATAGPEGAWTVVALRHHGGLPLYSKSDMMLRLSRDGQLVYLLTHRRPLLARSEYAARPPEEAWRLLQAGRGRQLGIGVESANVGDPGEQFVVAQVEIAAVASEPFLPQQLVPPYYCFRDARGSALYVPAIADPYVEWWA